MGITKFSMPRVLRRMLRKHILRRRHILCKPTFKKYRKQEPLIDIIGLLEEKMYDLNSSVLHLKLYIKKMMYEYCGETRQEIAVFYAMALNLYKSTSDDYYKVMNNKKSIIDVDIKKYEEEYEEILDLCGTTSNEVYENIFEENDDGYETPPRTIEELEEEALPPEFEDILSKLVIV
jgi:hypothetical protein